MSRRVRRVVRQNLAWAATYNAASVPLAVAGLMPPWLAGLGMAATVQQFGLPKQTVCRAEASTSPFGSIRPVVLNGCGECPDG